MAYKRKRTYRRRGTYGRRPRRSYKRRRMTRMVRTRRGYGSRIRKEIKAIDLDRTATADKGANMTALLVTTLNTNLRVINQIKEGSGFQQRIGRKINMKSVRINGMIRPTGTNVAVIPNQELRLIMFYDKQWNAATAFTLSTLLQDQTEAATTSSAMSGVNLNNRERFKILIDRKISCPQITVTAGPVITSSTGSWMLDGSSIETGGPVVNIYKKLGGLETQYNGTVGTSADINSGALVICLLTDGGTLTTNTNDWQFDGTIRLRYYDV